MDKETTLSDLTSVKYPPADQVRIYNYELRLAIKNGRAYPDGNKVMEGVWIGLHALGAITEGQYGNLIACYCNTRTVKGGVAYWGKLSDDAIILACDGLVEKDFDGITYRLLEINNTKEYSDSRVSYLKSLGYICRQVTEETGIRLYVHKAEAQAMAEPAEVTASPEPLPCAEPPDGTLFEDDPRTRIHLGGGVI